jgi:hypothetical protein
MQKRSTDAAWNMCGASRFFRHALALLCAGFWACGCASLFQPASASFASAKVGGVSEEAIRSEMAKVFRAAEYRTTPTSEGFVFEREGDRRDQIAYGGVGDPRPVRIRVKAQIVPLGGELYRLQCIAYAVRGYNMGEEIRLPFYRSGPYQELLDQVVGNLKPVSLIRK